MKNLYPTILCLIAMIHGHAQFSGQFDPNKWSTNLSAGSNGTVSLDGIPDFIFINGSDGGSGSNADTDFTILVKSTGRLRFSWMYHTNNSNANPQYDQAGFLINGVFTPLSNNAGGVDQADDFISPLITAGTVIGFRIRSVDNARGAAELTITNFTFTETILPVKLTDFTARIKDNGVDLQWKTAGETNFSHYELERAGEDMLFRQIQKLEGRNLAVYNTNDSRPVPGANFYRLRMVDKDGVARYSEVVSVKTADLVPGRLFPNPATATLSMELDALKQTKETVQILDLAGKVVQSVSFELNKGKNRIEFNTRSLPAGSYFLRLSSGQTRSFIRN